MRMLSRNALRILVVAIAPQQCVVAAAAVEPVGGAVAGEGVGDGVAGAVDGRGAGQGQGLDIVADRVADAALDGIGAAARTGLDRLVAMLSMM